MSYSTATTILTLLPGLPQSSGSAGYTNVVALITNHIARADSLIKGKISQRYDVSSFITNVPPLLKTLSEDITSYYTYRSEFSGDNINVNEWVEKYKEAIAMLEEIRNGTMDLTDSNDDLIEPTSPLGNVESNTEDYTPFFNEGNPVDWCVDANKLDE